MTYLSGSSKNILSRLSMLISLGLKSLARGLPFEEFLPRFDVGVKATDIRRDGLWHLGHALPMQRSSLARLSVKARSCLLERQELTKKRSNCTLKTPQYKVR